MSFARSIALVSALLAASVAAQATTVNLAADGQWNTFTVDSSASQIFGTEWIDADNSLDPSYGTPLSFTFSIAAGYQGILTVVDAGFAGDTFSVFNNNSLLGTTSAVAQPSYDGSEPLEFDFNAALASTAFSHGVFTLGAGNYSITGSLLQSALVSPSGLPLEATFGAVNLTVVPEPSSMALVLAGAGVLVILSRRRSAL